MGKEKKTSKGRGGPRPGAGRKNILDTDEKNKARVYIGASNVQKWETLKTSLGDGGDIQFISELLKIAENHLNKTSNIHDTRTDSDAGSQHSHGEDVHICLHVSTNLKHWFYKLLDHSSLKVSGFIVSLLVLYCQEKKLNIQSLAENLTESKTMDNITPEKTDSVMNLQPINNDGKTAPIESSTVENDINSHNSTIDRINNSALNNASMNLVNSEPCASINDSVALDLLVQTALHHLGPETCLSQENNTNGPESSALHHLGPDTSFTKEKNINESTNVILVPRENEEINNGPVTLFRQEIVGSDDSKNDSSNILLFSNASESKKVLILPKERQDIISTETEPLGFTEQNQINEPNSDVMMELPELNKISDKNTSLPASDSINTTVISYGSESIDRDPLQGLDCVMKSSISEGIQISSFSQILDNVVTPSVVTESNLERVQISNSEIGVSDTLGLDSAISSGISDRPDLEIENIQKNDGYQLSLAGNFCSGEHLSHERDVNSQTLIAVTEREQVSNIVVNTSCQINMDFEPDPEVINSKSGLFTVSENLPSSIGAGRHFTDSENFSIVSEPPSTVDLSQLNDSMDMANKEISRPNYSEVTNGVQVEENGLGLVNKDQFKPDNRDPVNKEQSLHICEICSSKFKTKHALYKHKRSVHSDKTFMCDHNPSCGQTFKTAVLRRKHVDRIHLKLKPFLCSYDSCKSMFFSKDELSQHVRVHHTLEKLFSCSWNDCAAKFRTKYQLTVHFRLHTKEKPLKCPYTDCTYRAKQKSSINWHVSKNHI